MKYNDKNFKQKLALLTMTYGNMDKLYGCLYITKYDNTSIQDIVNIKTGEVKERRLIKEYYRLNTNKIQSIYPVSGILFVNSKIMITSPQFNNLYYDTTLRVYNREGEIIFNINDCGISLIKYEIYEIFNNSYLLLIGTQSRMKYALIISKETYQVIKDMEIIRRYNSGKNEITLVLNEDNKNNALKYKIKNNKNF